MAVIRRLLLFFLVSPRCGGGRYAEDGGAPIAKFRKGTST